jgi:RimJ/RimL family protein N-acetyltransferase
MPGPVEPASACDPGPMGVASHHDVSQPPHEAAEEHAVSPPLQRPRVHLRVLVADDASWIVATDRAASTALARPRGWDVESLAAELADGRWAGHDCWGWAVVIDGQPSGFALVTDLDQPDADVQLRILPGARGRGAGREVLRQLADHHFATSPSLHRLTGRTHEHNVPMQRVFNAAGFRMEARYRESFRQADGSYAAEWGYALTRADWEAGRHRADQHGYDLHGLGFEVEETVEGPPAPGLLVRFLQEGRRVIGRFDAHEISDGELGGILSGDLLRYRWIQLDERDEHPREVTGRGRARVQRRKDWRLEIVDQWSDDEGGHGRRVLVERMHDGP